MRPIFLSITLAAFILPSCDDRGESFSQFNVAPLIFFNGSQSVVSIDDSIKIGSGIKPIGESHYLVVMSAQDIDGRISSVNYTVNTGTAAIFVNDSELNGSLPLETDPIDLKIVPNLGISTITFEAVDNFGKAKSATIKLFAFDNLLPVADVVFTHSKETGPYEYTFNASGSYDQDRLFGGAITQYEYVINDVYTIKTDQSIIKHVFPGPGGYRVKYRVYDNEGATSEFITAPQITL